MAVQFPSITKRLNDYLQTSRNKSYFVIAMTALFVVLVLLVGVIPAVSAVSLQREENKKRDEVLAQLEAKLNTLKNMTTESKSKEGLINYFNQSFPNNYTQEKFIESLNKFANQTNILLFTITFADQASIGSQPAQKYLAGEQVKAQDVNLFFEGSNESIHDFIVKLETSRAVYDVKSLSVSKKVGSDLSTSPAGREYRCTLTVTYFYFEQPGPVSGASEE